MFLLDEGLPRGDSRTHDLVAPPFSRVASPWQVAKRMWGRCTGNKRVTSPHLLGWTAGKVVLGPVPETTVLRKEVHGYGMVSHLCPDVQGNMAVAWSHASVTVRGKTEAGNVNLGVTAWRDTHSHGDGVKSVGREATHCRLRAGCLFPLKLYLNSGMSLASHVIYGCFHSGGTPSPKGDLLIVLCLSGALTYEYLSYITYKPTRTHLYAHTYIEMENTCMYIYQGCVCITFSGNKTGITPSIWIDNLPLFVFPESWTFFCRTVQVLGVSLSVLSSKQPCGLLYRFIIKQSSIHRQLDGLFIFFFSATVYILRHYFWAVSQVSLQEKSLRG